MTDIWMYWESRPGSAGMPSFVRHCVETVRRNAGSSRVHLLDQQSVRAHLPDVRPEWGALTHLAHKADYVRTRLVLKHGGLWVDCDMCAIQPLETLIRIPPQFDFACQGVAQAIGCFSARPGCDLLRQIAKAQDAVLDSSPDGFGWNAIGNDLFGQLGAGYPCHLWPKWTVDEIAGAKISKLLLETERLTENVDGNAVVFHFCGNLLGPLLDTYAPARKHSLLVQPMLMSRIIRRGLGLPEPSRWQQNWNRARVSDMRDGAWRRLSRWAATARRGKASRASDRG
jgi:Capsular polysaccharide synthesis protein